MKVFRVFLATIFFVASVAFLVVESGLHPMARVAPVLQILPSALSATIGVTVFWLLITFIFGRIYCSTVCPVGSLQDGALYLRRRIPKFNRPFRYSHPKRWRYDLLLAYLLCLLLGVSVVCFILEPWNIMRNIFSAVNPSAVEQTWATLAFGAAGGMLAGAVSLLALLLLGFFRGREFCNTICPIGTALGVVGERALWHIEIDPDKCTGCLKCEDRCPSQCIKVVSRYVDNSRCVRCFDCIDLCKEDAIRFQFNRNRPATPLLRKKEKI